VIPTLTAECGLALAGWRSRGHRRDEVIAVDMCDSHRRAPISRVIVTKRYAAYGRCP